MESVGGKQSQLSVSDSAIQFLSLDDTHKNQAYVKNYERLSRKLLYP